MMIQSDKTGKSPDTIIVGGGILGLWAARHAILRGESVLLLEKRKIGAGASGGFLGALMPHMPDVWNPKKQMQYEGLNSISGAIARLESDTGLDCGFRRCGRIMPLAHDKVLPQVERRISGSRQHWGSDYKLSLANEAETECLVQQGWINPQVAASGIQQDTLSARVSPRACLGALEAHVSDHANVQEGADVVALDPGNAGEDPSVRLVDGSRISAGKVVIANGWEAYPLLQPYFDGINNGNPIGRGVKGQAVLVAFDHQDDLPIVYHDGVYVVPHAGNRVAIGSTSVNDWEGAPDAFDENDMAFYEKAQDLVPALRNAPIVGRWAGVRPRNTLGGRGTSPWFGPVSGHENVIALVGGFKITFGLAHLDSINSF